MKSLENKLKMLDNSINNLTREFISLDKIHNELKNMYLNQYKQLLNKKNYILKQMSMKIDDTYCKSNFEITDDCLFCNYSEPKRGDSDVYFKCNFNKK